MTGKMQIFTFLNQTLDEYQSVWRHSKLVAMQLSGRALEADNTIVTAPGCVMARTTSAQSLLLNWHTGDEILMVFPLRPCSIFALGRSLGPEQQLALTPDHEVTMITPASSDLLLVFLGRNLLKANLGAAKASRFMELIAGIETGSVICAGKAEVTDVIAGLFRRMCGSASSHGLAAGNDGQAELVSCLHAYVSAASTGNHREVDNHERIVSRVIGLLLDEPGVNHDLDAISEHSCCSRRTLANAFDRHFGMSPMRFVAIIKLNWFRRDMRRLASERELPMLMTNYGFTNPGRLNAEYRKIFGEKPRETIERWKTIRSLHYQLQPLPGVHT